MVVSLACMSLHYVYMVLMEIRKCHQISLELDLNSY